MQPISISKAPPKQVQSEYIWPEIGSLPPRIGPKLERIVRELGRFLLFLPELGALQKGQVQGNQAVMASATLLCFALPMEPRSFSMAFMPEMLCSGEMSA